MLAQSYMFGDAAPLIVRGSEAVWLSDIERITASRAAQTAPDSAQDIRDGRAEIATRNRTRQRH